MRKLSYFFSIAVLAGMVAISGCKKDDPEPVVDCDNESFPATTGSATIDVLNINNQSGGFFVMDAAAGNVLSLAIEVTKGSQRPQKLRLYQTDCANTLGTIVDVSGQPGAEDGGKRIDLRNTDDAQVRQVLYTVPSGYSTLYLNIEIDESGSKYSYKRIKLNISNSGIIDSWTSISLGGNSSATPSRLSSGSGQTYGACNAAANIGYVDITYAVGTGTGNPSFLCSNPARFSSPVSLTTSSASCGEDGTLSTAGGNATYFKAYAGSDFNTITNAGLAALTVSSSDNQYVQIALGSVYEFLNSSGKKGLVKVVSGTLSNTNSDIVVEVKVQR